LGQEEYRGGRQEVFPSGSFYGTRMMTERGRLDRQLRIPQWNQDALTGARVGVVGDYGLMTSLYLLGTAALGINQVWVIAPRLDERILSLARRLNPDWQLNFFEGFLTHPGCREVLGRDNLVVDLSTYGLSNKIILEEAFQHKLMVLRGYSGQNEGDEFKIFGYARDREWLELQEVISEGNLPGRIQASDGVLDIIAAGIILEETKNFFLQGSLAPKMSRYCRPRLLPPVRQPSMGIVGAGALGNFVGLGLALAGFRNLTFIDPDVIELTNLNRQVFFAGAVGAGKAETLADRLNRWFGTRARGVEDYFQSGEDISEFEVVFDCVDNFATRMALSEACAAADKILISGGSDVSKGQVVVYHPERQPQTPAELLGLSEIVAGRAETMQQRQRAACVYQPDPAVIMTNQIIAGFMVEGCRKVLAGMAAPPLFYDAAAEDKFSFAEN
jgi:molybdopterin/thiamine biosynthesis adenylyltransferase